MATTGISGSGVAGPPEYGHAAPTSFWALTLGTIGVVYGYIGTSPFFVRGWLRGLGWTATAVMGLAVVGMLTTSL